MASLVPDPMVKWAVWAASPSRTTLPWCQLWQRTVTKLIHSDRDSAWPPSSGANRSWQAAMLSDSPAWSSPAARQVSSVLHDEGAGVGVEGVGVDLEHAVGVVRKMKVKASRGRSVPNQMNLDRCTSGVGRSWASSSRRAVELTPSAATTRSRSASSSRSGASRWKASSTPTSRQRRWRISSSRLRAMAENTCPPERTVRPP